MGTGKGTKRQVVFFFFFSFTSLLEWLHVTVLVCRVAQESLRDSLMVCLPSTEKWAWTPPCDCQEINWRKHFPCRLERLSQRVGLCVCVCAPPPHPHPNHPPTPTILGWDLRGNGQISICPPHLKKRREKKPSCDSNICFSHLSLSLSLSCLPLLAVQVASADDQGLGSLRGQGGGGVGGGEKERRDGGKERERGSKRLSLHISPAPPLRASQPAVCSPLSFLFYHGAGGGKKNQFIFP